MSFVTTRVGNTFGASGNTLPPQSYYDMNDNNYVQREVIKMTFADTEDQSALFGLLAYLTGVGYQTKSKKPEWVIGDGEKRTVALNGALTVGALLSTVNLQFTNGERLSNNQLVYLYETDTNGSTGETYVRTAIIKYSSTSPANSVVMQRNMVGPTATYTDAIKNGVGEAAGADYVFSDALTCVVLPTDMPYDGKVGGAIEYAPNFLTNVMQRSREAIEIGTHTHSDFLLYEGDMNTQSRIKWISFAEKFNSQLHVSRNYKEVSTTNNGSGEFGGFPFFYRPDGTDLVDAKSGDTITGMHGYNKVIQDNAIDFDTLEEIMNRLRRYGGKDKIFIMPGHIMLRFTKMARSHQVLNGSDTYSFPQFPDVMMSMPSISTAFGKCFLMLDDGMEGLSMAVVDTDDETIQANGTNYVLMLDPKTVKLGTHIVDNGPDAGVQDFRLRPVTLAEDNNSIEKNGMGLY
jgi:hypothetical protein